MTRLAITILTAILALGVTVARVTNSSAHGTATAVTGTVTAVYVHSTGTALVLRTGSNRLADLIVPIHAVMKSADGHTIGPANILLGDRLVVSAGGAVKDLSQRQITLKGIVSVAPLSSGDPLIVQASATSSVLIDLSSQTKYSDASHETSKLNQLADADQVQIRGLFDAQEDEVTQAQSVSRLGPFHKKAAGQTA
jgi:hypothetical protein